MADSQLPAPCTPPDAQTAADRQEALEYWQACQDEDDAEDAASKAAQPEPLQPVPSPKTPREEQAEESQVPALDSKAGKQPQPEPLQPVPSPRTPGEEQAEESQVPALDSKAGRQPQPEPLQPVPSAKRQKTEQAEHALDRAHLPVLRAQAAQNCQAPPSAGRLLHAHLPVLRAQAAQEQAALDRQASSWTAITAQHEAEQAAWNAAQLAGLPAQREHLRQCLVAEPESEAVFLARLQLEQPELFTDRPEDLAEQHFFAQAWLLSDQMRERDPDMWAANLQAFTDDQKAARAERIAARLAAYSARKQAYLATLAASELEDSQLPDSQETLVAGNDEADDSQADGSQADRHQAADTQADSMEDIIRQTAMEEWAAVAGSPQEDREAADGIKPLTDWWLEKKAADGIKPLPAWWLEKIAREAREADQAAAERQPPPPPAPPAKRELPPPLQAASASPPGQAASSSGLSGEAISMAGQAAFGPVDTHPARLIQRPKGCLRCRYSQRGCRICESGGLQSQPQPASSIRSQPVAGCFRCRYSWRGCLRCRVQTANTEEMEEME